MRGISMIARAVKVRGLAPFILAVPVDNDDRWKIWERR